MSYVLNGSAKRDYGLWEPEVYCYKELPGGKCAIQVKYSFRGDKDLLNDLGYGFFTSMLDAVNESGQIVRLTRDQVLWEFDKGAVNNVLFTGKLDKPVVRDMIVREYAKEIVMENSGYKVVSGLDGHVSVMVGGKDSHDGGRTEHWVGQDRQMVSKLLSNVESVLEKYSRDMAGIEPPSYF